MEDRLRFWWRAATHGWHRVISVRDHVEAIAAMLVLAGVTVGLGIWQGWAWLLPAVMAFTLAGLVLDGAFTQWRDTRVELDLQREMQQEKAALRVPQNREMLIRWVRQFENALTEYVGSLEFRRDALPTYPRSEDTLNAMVRDSRDKLREVERELEIQTDIAGQGFVRSLGWYRMKWSLDASLLEYEDEATFDSAKFRDATRSLLGSIDDGSLYRE